MIRTYNQHEKLDEISGRYSGLYDLVSAEDELSNLTRELDELDDLIFSEVDYDVSSR